MKKVSEKDIQDAILDYLKVIGIFAWRQNTGCMEINEGSNRRFIRFGLVGMSDILGVLPDGRMLAIEVKTDKGKTTEYQEAFLNKVKDSNGVSFVARSIEDVQANLYGKVRI